MRLLALSLAAAAFAAPAVAQTQPLPRTYDIMVADSTSNTLVRLSDITQNGKYNLPGEWTLHYDALLASGGAPALDTPASLAFDGKGHLYCADTGADMVLRTIDRGGDGAALDGSLVEWQVWLDNSNASAVTFASQLVIKFDAQGRMFGVNSGAGVTPLDFVWRAVDVNGDGDANDAGEVKIVYDSTAGGVNIQVPFGLAVDPANGDLYVSDVNPDGIYRLRDLNADGDYYDLGEIGTVYTGTQPGPGLSNANSLAFAPDGDLYVNDATLDVIIRLRDLDLDGDFEDAGEATLFASAAGNPFAVPKNQFGIEIDEDGRIFAVENSTGHYVVRYSDDNDDGDAQDPNEVALVYDEAAGPGTLVLPRALALVPAPRMLSSNGATVQVGQILNLQVKGFELDSFVMLLGLQPLPGGPASVPPFGYIGYVPLLTLTAGNLDLNGNIALNFPVPTTGVPTPLPLYFSSAVGKLPYRNYLTNDLVVTVVP